MRRKKRKNIMAELLMILLMVIIIFPLYFMVVNSLKAHEEYVVNMVGMPAQATFQNYIEAFQGKPFGQWIWNSFFLTAAATLVTAAVALLCGYAFAKMEFKGKNFLFQCIIPLMSVPPEIGRAHV